MKHTARETLFGEYLAENDEWGDRYKVHWDNFLPQYGHLEDLVWATTESNLGKLRLTLTPCRITVTSLTSRLSLTIRLVTLHPKSCVLLGNKKSVYHLFIWNTGQIVTVEPVLWSAEGGSLFIKGGGPGQSFSRLLWDLRLWRGPLIWLHLRQCLLSRTCGTSCGKNHELWKLTSHRCPSVSQSVCLSACRLSWLYHIYE